MTPVGDDLKKTLSKKKGEGQKLKLIKDWATNDGISKTHEEYELAARFVARVQEIWVYVAGFAAAVGAISIAAVATQSEWVASKGGEMLPLYLAGAAAALVITSWAVSVSHVVGCIRLRNTLDVAEAESKANKVTSGNFFWWRKD